ncbi:mannosyltransferase [Dentipellis sp. KUC8613]|nr:mannosyltransferase [Dentipellis sp. KUC8613]
MASLVSFAFNFVQRLLTDPRHFWSLAGLVILGDAVLTQLIIRFVPYTEIDWETYMYHIALYLKGERNYANITGPTGPLVYPAGHVHIHEELYKVTNLGTNLPLAQQIYAALYLASLTISCAIYRKAGSIPNWVVLLLPLSKRLHSIFVLRLFNDCWEVVLAQLAVLAYANGSDELGTLLLSFALSVKMSAFLYLPGAIVILFRRRGMYTTLRLLVTIASVQAVLAINFLRDSPWSYLKNAFDLSRVFLYKWTVNWRFIDEPTFLSPTFAKALLLGHFSVLVVFGLTRWCRNDGGVLSVIQRGLRRPQSPAGLTTLTADEAVTILWTSNLIGLLFARSLHYQFYSWYAQQTPFLAWKTPYPVPIKIALLLAIEYSWNVYPSTNASSGILAPANAALLIGVWLGRRSSPLAVKVE